MKKFALFLAAIIGIAALPASSCKSSPAGGDTAEQTAQHTLNSALGQVYDKYKSGLLLDRATTYTVVPGNTLAHIATAHYGKENGYYFPIIMMASSDTVQDPDLIEPGMNLTLPDLQENLDDPIARANIKAFLKEIAEVYTKSSKPHKKEMVSALTSLSESL
jgi:hypothetical protein